MPYRSYIVEDRQGEPVFKALIPYSGNVFRDFKPDPFKVILDF